MYFYLVKEISECGPCPQYGANDSSEDLGNL